MCCLLLLKLLRRILGALLKGAMQLLLQYVLAHALRALYRGQQERVGDLISLLFVALEQASLDQGSMDLAYLYTLLPDPRDGARLSVGRNTKLRGSGG